MAGVLCLVALLVMDVFRGGGGGAGRVLFAAGCGDSCCEGYGAPADAVCSYS